MTTGDISDGAAPTPASSASAPNGGAAPELRGAGGGAGTAASSSGMKKGPWTAAEDAVLVEYVRTHGEGNWNAVQRNTGLSRCGKSCRLRWANHLRPNLKKGSFSPEEERLILQLHAQMGNKWARMAAQLPGRTDNEIKNYWNTRLKRRHRAGLPLYPPDIQRHAALHRPSTSARVPPSIFDQKLQLSAPVSSSNPFSRSATAAGTATMDTTVINPFFFGHPRPQFFTPTDDHQKKMKRLRDDMSFTLPSSIDLAQPRPPQASLFQYNPPLGNYDLGPPRPYALQQQSFSLKTELPSSQLYPGPATAGTSHGNVSGQPLEPSNSELWDALLNDDTPHPVCGSSNNAGDGGDRYQREFFIPELVLQDVKWEKASMVNALPAGTGPSPGMTLEPADGWNDSNVSADSTLKTAPAPEMGSMEDELASLLDGIPMATIPTVAAPAAAFREWLTSDSGEDSHGQSSAVTDEVGLDMQQLASSLSMAPEGDHGWSLGPCHWDGTPGVR